MPGVSVPFWGAPIPSLIADPFERRPFERAEREGGTPPALLPADPDLEPAKTDLSTYENVGQLVLSGDDREDDDDGEPSLAVPEVPERYSQEIAVEAAPIPSETSLRWISTPRRTMSYEREATSWTFWRG